MLNIQDTKLELIQDCIESSGTIMPHHILIILLVGPGSQRLQLGLKVEKEARK